MDNCVELEIIKKIKSESSEIEVLFVGVKGKTETRPDLNELIAQIQDQLDLAA